MSHHPFWDSLSSAELEGTKDAVDVLTACSWAQPLIDHARTRCSLPAQIEQRQDFTPENLSDFFELRFAAELARTGRTAEYEFAAGVGNSTIDFRVPGPPNWLIELVSLRTTQAVEASTVEHDGGGGVATYSHLLLSDSSDPKNTEEYEMMVAIGKILEKAANGGKPTKFPIPSASFHVVLADVRGYLGRTGGDHVDYIQMAIGAGMLQGDDRMLAKAVPGTRLPIRGVFEPKNPLVGAQHFRERVHFLGFVAEHRYEPGEISAGILLFNNMTLFDSGSAVAKAASEFPLPGGRVHKPVLRPTSGTPQ